MPFYAYIDKQDKVQSPNNTFDPSIIKTIAKKYRKVESPLNNPVFDSENNLFREMTESEIEANIEDKKSIQLEQDIQNLNSCRMLELYDVMKDDTLLLAKFNEWKELPEFYLEPIIRFDYPIVKAEIEKLDDEVFYNLKKQIVLNRSV